MHLNKKKFKRSYIVKILITILFIFLINLGYFSFKVNIHKKRIGIIGVPNDQNVGNLLVKFSMFMKLKELGFEPTIISSTYRGKDINFLKKTVNLLEIKRTFNEVNQSNFDYLMVNSDQTWNNVNLEHLYDIGFLRFAKKSNVKKFVYGASLGFDFWRYPKDFDKNASLLLKNLTGFQFVKLVQLI